MIIVLQSPGLQSKLMTKSRVDQTSEKTKEIMPIFKQPLLSTESISVRSAKKKDGSVEGEDKSSLWNTCRSSQKRLTFDDLDRTAEDSADNSVQESSHNEGFTPKKRNSSSPVENISASNLSHKTKSETLLDQICVARQNVRHQWPVSSNQIIQGTKDNGDENHDSYVKSNNVAINIIMEPLLNPSHRHVDSQGFLEPQAIDNVMKTPKFGSNCNLARFTNNDYFISSPNTTNRIPMRFCSKSHLLMTSTPAPGNGCIVTPIVDKNNSMSPITRSTQRMPKAMQVIRK